MWLVRKSKLIAANAIIEERNETIKDLLENISIRIETIDGLRENVLSCQAELKASMNSLHKSNESLKAEEERSKGLRTIISRLKDEIERMKVEETNLLNGLKKISEITQFDEKEVANNLNTADEPTEFPHEEEIKVMRVDQSNLLEGIRKLAAEKKKEYYDNLDLISERGVISEDDDIIITGDDECEESINVSPEPTESQAPKQQKKYKNKKRKK